MGIGSRLCKGSVQLRHKRHDAVLRPVGDTGIKGESALFLFDVPIDAVEQDSACIEAVHVTIARQTFFGRSDEVQREVAETVACSVTQDVAYRVFLSTSKFKVEMRQQGSKRVLPDAKAVHLSCQLFAEIIDASKQRVEPLVGGYREAEVACKCLCFDEFGREICIERKVERMDDAVGCSELDGFNACFQAMRLLEIGSAVKVHHHARRKWFLR